MGGHHRLQPCGQLQDHLELAKAASHQEDNKKSSKRSTHLQFPCTAHVERPLKQCVKTFRSKILSCQLCLRTWSHEAIGSCLSCHHECFVFLRHWVRPYCGLNGKHMSIICVHSYLQQRKFTYQPKICHL